VERNAGTLQRPVSREKAAGWMHACRIDFQPGNDAPDSGILPGKTRLGVELNGTLERPGDSVPRWSVGTIYDKF